MMKAITFGFIAALLTMSVTAPATAQNVQSEKRQASDLYRLVDNSDGYVSIRDNILLIEGETQIKVCHFGLTPDLFAAYAAGDADGIKAATPMTVCVPLSAFEVKDGGTSANSGAGLYNLFDESEGYTTVAPNIVMVESEDNIQFCHFDISDGLFAAIAGRDTAAVAKNTPAATCIPFEAIQP